MTVYMLQNLDWPDVQFLGIFSTLDLAKAAFETGGIPWKKVCDTHQVRIPGNDGTYTITPIEVDKIY